jgi:putative protease
LAQKEAEMEILAPVGSREMLEAAVRAGADAVYFGVGAFNARRGAEGFSSQSLLDAVSYCHARGVAAYAAVNTIVFPSEWKEAARACEDVASSGADAAIVADLGIASLFRSACPSLPLHASTQAGLHSLKGVEAAARMGFSRAILARELSIEEIGAIAAKSPIPVEVFVHGALCYAVSGQCWMSSFLGGRSANRGNCAGACRLPFAFCREGGEERRPQEGESLLSLKDLSALPLLGALDKAGVASAKIEGRLKGPEYAASAVDAACRARDGKAWDESLLAKIFSRSGFTNKWMAGKSAKGDRMFGARAPSQEEETKKALPQARGLYRRERPSVPVFLRLSVTESGEALLAASDGANEATSSLPLPGPMPKGAKEAAQSALSKTGGTPFFAGSVELGEGAGLLPAPAVAALRAKALESLLEARGKAKPHAFSLPPKEALPLPPMRRGRDIAVFWDISQVGPEHWDAFEEVALPLSQRGKIPKGREGKARLALPRFLPPGAEEAFALEAKKAAEDGFRKFYAQSLAHIEILSAFRPGADVFAGFGLNCANGHAAQALAQAGADEICASVEVSLKDIGDMAKSSPVPIALVYYGRLPVMLSRACPRMDEKGCEGCPGRWKAVGSKGPAFPARCQKNGGDCAIELYNPIPLWAGGLAGAQAFRAAFLFPAGGKGEAMRALGAYGQKQPPFAFTRGLYRAHAGKAPANGNKG